MTHQEILLLLLEEAQEYNYLRINIFFNYRFKPLEEIDIQADNIFSIGHFRDAFEQFKRGFILQLCCSEEEFSDIDGVIRKTKNKLSITHCPVYNEIYICLEKE